MLQRLRRHSTLAIVAASCLVIGAGAGAIANAGATGSSPIGSHQTGSHPTGTGPAGWRGYTHRAGLGRLGRAVHGNIVLATRNGFVHVTFDRGTVKSVSGNRLDLNDGTKTKTYKTVTLTIPAGARVRDNGARAALADVKPGQRTIVIQAPKHTWVIAHDAR